MFPGPSTANDVLNEIDLAHRRLSPPAQTALEQAHSQLFGQPATPGILPTTPVEAPRPMATPTAAAKSPFPASTSPEGTALMGGEPATGPRPLASPLQSAHERYQDLAGSPSGIGGIKSPWARIPLQIAQGIGSTFLPGLTMAIPGTDLHHQLLLHQAAKGVNQEESASDEESKRQLEAAQAEHARAQAEALAHPKGETNEFAPLPTATGITAFNKRTGTAAPLKGAEGDVLQPFEKEKPETSNIHVLPDGNVVAIHTDPHTGEATAHVVYKGDPKVQTHVTQLEVGGKPHSVLVNSQTGETIKDLGMSGVKPPTVNVNAENTRKFQEAERGRGLLDKAEANYRSAASKADQLSNFIDAAQAGNRITAKVLPLEGALVLSSGNQIHRINRTEVEQFEGGGSLYDRIVGKLGGIAEGQPIPANLQADYRKLADILRRGAYKEYRGAFESAKKRYSLGPEEAPLPEPGGGAADPAVKAYADKYFGGDLSKAQAAIDQQKGKK